MLERGIPLLLEKPPGETVAEVDRLIAAAERGGRRVPHQVAFNRRFAPLVRELRRRIEEAGPLQHVHYEMTRVERRDPDFSTTAIHGLDAVRYLAGCDYAEARFRYRELPELGTGVANILVDAVMASGATAHLAFSPVAGVLVERASAHAHGHSLFLHVPMWSGVDSPGRLWHYAGGRWRRSWAATRVGDGTALFELGGFYRETVAFLDALAGGRAPSPSLRESRQSVEIAERIRQRAAEYRRLAARGQNGEAHEASDVRRGDRRARGPGGAGAGGGARPDAPDPPRRVEGDRPRRGRDDAPPGDQPARPARSSLLGCDMTGAYVTGDGGASWRMINFGSVPTAFAFDPSRPQTLYAGAEAVYKSDDAGRTWRMVLPDPAKNTVAKPIGDHGDRVLFTDDPAYPGSGRSVTIHAIARGRGRPGPRVGRGERGRLAGPRHAGVADAPPRLDRRRAHVVAGRQLRLGARLRAPARAAARRRQRVHALGETGVYEGAGPSLQHVPAPGGARFTSGSFGRDPRSGVVFAYATLPLVAGPGGTAGGVQVSEDGGRTWRAANGSLLGAVRVDDGGNEWGPGEGLAAVARADRRLRPLPARRLRGPARHRARRPRRQALQRDREDDGRRTAAGASCTRSRTSRRRTSTGSWIEPRAAEDGHSVWFDSPYDLAVAPNDPDVAYATDLFRTYRTVDGGQGVGPGQLRAPRRRPLDDARPRRHDHLRRPVRPARREARLHPVHRHRPLPQRGRGRDLDGLLDGHPHARGATRPTGSPSTPR